MLERYLTVPAGLASMAAGCALGVVAGDAAVVAAAAGAIVAGHLVTMPGSADRPIPLTLAVLAAVALLHGGSPFDVPGAALAGIPPGILAARIRHGRRVAADLRAGESTAAAAFTIVVLATVPVLTAGQGFAARSLHIAAVGAAAVTWHLAGSLGWAFWSGRRRRLSARLWLRRGLAEWQPFVTLFVAGAMYAEAVPVVGWWAVVVAGLPYLFGHLAVERLRRVRSTYRQTIRALGRLPEAGGFVAPGHAERTADLAVAAGAEIGCGARESEHIEYASLLHDLGRVVLADRSITAAGYGRSDIAEWSAAIIAEAGHLAPVAEIVAAYPRPYRSHGEARSPSVPRASKLLRVASAYDDSVGSGLAPVEALEALHRGAAYDYDPEAVIALRRVLERRGSIAP